MDGNIPVLYVRAPNIPAAWETAVLEVWHFGCDVKTEYDKPEDPASKDATVIITVDDPFAEPRIHKNFPGGPTELESYRQEVVDGIHNHWIDPANGKWTYTYNERLFAYSPCENLKDPNSPRPFIPVNQIDFIINNLAKSGHTRRAQGVTYMPSCDPKTSDPPCLQRVWCRMLKDDNGQWVLNMNTHWRSRDLYKAWFMNVYALTDLMKKIAEGVSAKIGQPVKVGRYVDVSDSLHIYGSYFGEAVPEIQKMIESPLYPQRGRYGITQIEQERSNDAFYKRTWSTDHPAFSIMTEEAKQNLATNPDYYSQGDK